MLLSLPSFDILITYMLYFLKLSHSYWIFHYDLFHSIFLFAFEFGKFLLAYIQAYWFLLQHVQSTDKPIKGIIYFFLCLFILRHRESEGGNPKQAPGSAQSLMWGSISWLWPHDLSQNQESDAYPTEPPRCLGHSLLLLILFFGFWVFFKIISSISF